MADLSSLKGTNFFQFGRIIEKSQAGALEGGQLKDLTRLIQTKPITGQLAESIVSTEEFFTGAQQFEDKYYQLIAEKKNLKLAHRDLNTSLFKQLGIIDLSILNFEDELEMKNLAKNQYKILDMFHNVGFPGIEIPPGANQYRRSFKYEVDQDIVHPLQVIYNQANLSIDPRSIDFADLSVNTQNIMSADQMKRNMAQIQARREGRLFGSINLENILTIDVETSDVMSGKQVRSVGVSRQTFDATTGQISAPSVVDDLSFGFKSPRLGGVVGARNSSLIEEIAAREGLTMLEEEEAIGKFTNLFREMVNADRIVAHNANFDINEMVKTISGLKSYNPNSELGDLIQQFVEKRSQNDMYFMDTLEIGRNYLTEKANELVNARNPVDGIERGRLFQEALFGTEMSQVNLAGKATYVGVTNYAVNTNLLDLMADDANGRHILNKVLVKGSHVAEVDTGLQAYILKYVNSGELEFRKDYQTVSLRSHSSNAAAAISKEQMIELARTRIQRSAQLAPMTNVTDLSIESMSQRMYEYISGDEGIKNVKIGTTTDDMLQYLTPGQIISNQSKGYIKYHGGSFRYFAEGGDEVGYELNQEAAGKYIRNILASARDDSVAQANQMLLNITTPLGQTTTINRAALDIMSTGFDYLSKSSYDQMIENLGHPMTTVSDFNVKAFAENTGLIYKNFMERPAPKTFGQAFSQISGRADPTFDMSLNTGMVQGDVTNFTFRKFTEYGKTLAEIGDPFYFLHPTDKVSSMLISRATSRIAQNKYAEGIGKLSQGKLSETELEQYNDIVKTFGYAKNQTIYNDIFSNIGISHAYMQSESYIEGAGGTFSKKPILPYEYVAEALQEKMPTAAYLSIAEMPETTRPGLGGMEVIPPYQRANISARLDRSQAEILAQKLLDDHLQFQHGSSIVSRFDTKTNEQVTALISDVRQRMADEGLDTADDLVHEAFKREMSTNLMERDVVVGYFNDQFDEDIENLISDLKRMGKDVSGSDVPLRVSFQIAEAKHGTLILSPAYNDGAATAAGLVGRIQTAAKTAVQDLLPRLEESFTEGSDLTKIATRSRKAAISGREISDIVRIYEELKPKLGMAALGVGALGIGYYMYKKTQENNLYSETMESQPYEVGSSYRQQDYSEFGSSRLDTLSTAGVVGGLDRGKIGHNRMGNNKYSHLYGGQ